MDFIKFAALYPTLLSKHFASKSSFAFLGHVAREAGRLVPVAGVNSWQWTGSKGAGEQKEMCQVSPFNSFQRGLHFPVESAGLWWPGSSNKGLRPSCKLGTAKGTRFGAL